MLESQDINLQKRERATKRWDNKGKEIENGNSHQEWHISQGYLSNKLQKDTPINGLHGLRRNYSDPPTPVQSTLKGGLAQNTHLNRHADRYWSPQINHRWIQSSPNLSIPGGFQEEERDAIQGNSFIQSEEINSQYTKPKIETFVSIIIQLQKASVAIERNIY
ncbi:hypothetical protein O181_003638 [Austropuccinia psidii MF-1]|uniref:Uncharacterized protein n=1 Tax=Austropuccinia psidii MF-1 TaxID=1389203 RepID=A0A9Q3BET4_9BASI|nr:hypothetical protein [Austropuccinia psidii MF-1]